MFMPNQEYPLLPLVGLAFLHLVCFPTYLLMIRLLCARNCLTPALSKNITHFLMLTTCPSVVLYFPLVSIMTQSPILMGFLIWSHIILSFASLIGAFFFFNNVFNLLYFSVLANSSALISSVSSLISKS